jgi:light-regulated signal transduction histidine kinase (bacteriophytochrome)
MFEFDPADVIGRNAEEINISNIGERNAKVRQIKESGGSVQGMESNFVLSSGKVVNTFVSVESIDLDGDLCLLSAYFDLKERIQAENIIKQKNRLLEEKNMQLEQTNAELASFSFVASHDLQEPLRKIQTFSNRILDLGENEFSNEVKDYFNRILSATSRMKNLISDLLNYSRMNNTEMKLELTDLNVLVREAKNNLDERIAETNAQLRIGQLPTVEVIPHQFTQVFNNILANAIKYRKPGEIPKIEMSSRIIEGRMLSHYAADRNFNYHKISIADNGIGFEPIHAFKIFELFQRLHGVNQYEGTGIGLAICKKIMQNHRGFIEAEGAPGVGAVFTLYLPADTYETQNHSVD